MISTTTDYNKRSVDDTTSGFQKVLTETLSVESLGQADIITALSKQNVGPTKEHLVKLFKVLQHNSTIIQNAVSSCGGGSLWSEVEKGITAIPPADLAKSRGPDKTALINGFYQLGVAYQKLETKRFKSKKATTTAAVLEVMQYDFVCETLLKGQEKALEEKSGQYGKYLYKPSVEEYNRPPGHSGSFLVGESSICLRCSHPSMDEPSSNGLLLNKNLVKMQEWSQRMKDHEKEKGEKKRAPTKPIPEEPHLRCTCYLSTCLGGGQSTCYQCKAAMKENKWKACDAGCLIGNEPCQLCSCKCGLFVKKTKVDVIKRVLAGKKIAADSNVASDREEIMARQTVEGEALSILYRNLPIELIMTNGTTTSSTSTATQKRQRLEAAQDQLAFGIARDMVSDYEATNPLVEAAMGNILPPSRKILVNGQQFDTIQIRQTNGHREKNNRLTKSQAPRGARIENVKESNLRPASWSSAPPPVAQNSPGFYRGPSRKTVLVATSAKATRGQHKTPFDISISGCGGLNSVLGAGVEGTVTPMSDDRKPAARAGPSTSAILDSDYCEIVMNQAARAGPSTSAMLDSPDYCEIVDPRELRRVMDPPYEHDSNMEQALLASASCDLYRRAGARLVHTINEGTPNSKKRAIGTYSSFLDERDKMTTTIEHQIESANRSGHPVPNSQEALDWCKNFLPTSSP